MYDYEFDVDDPPTTTMPKCTPLQLCPLDQIPCEICRTQTATRLIAHRRPPLEGQGIMRRLLCDACCRKAMGW